MTNIYLDIETTVGPNRPSLDSVQAPANYKDPEKIKAYKESKLEEVYRVQALDSMQGRLLCTAWALDNNPVQALTVGLGDIQAEQELLQELEAKLLEMPHDLNIMQWVGHNIKTFDLIWLWRKALKYRLWDLARYIPRQRYDKRVVDTLELWAADYRDKVSLQSIADFLGLDGKADGMDGSQVVDLWQENRLQEIQDYCCQDVELVRQVHKIMEQAI